MKRICCILLALLLCLPAAVSADDAQKPRMKQVVDYIATNSAGADQAYIVSDTSQASELWRVCDVNREVVYRFALSDWNSPSFRFQIANNYLLEASPDGETYTKVADYGELSGKWFDGSYYNQTFFAIDPADYQCEEELYVRLSNCKPDQGWGGAVLSFSIFHEVLDESDDVPLFGDLDGNGAVEPGDALIALQYTVDLRSLNAAELRVGDMNLDDAVDAADALQMLQLAVELLVHCKADLEQNALLRPGARFLFIGDSVTDAQRDHNDPTSLGTGYVKLINEALSVGLPELETTVVNRGLNGTRTHDWLPLVQQTLDEAHADVVTVGLGINDTWRRYDQNMPCSVEEYGDNLRTILSAAEQTGAKLIVISPFALEGSSVDITGWHQDDLNAKIAMCEQVANEFDALYIPMDELFHGMVAEAPGPIFTHDGIHPNEAGSFLMATLCAVAVDSLGVYLP